MKFNYKMARSPCKHMEKTSTPAAVAAVDFIAPHPKTSPLKEHILDKPPFYPEGVTAPLFSLNNNTRPVHNKENRKEYDRRSELLPGSSGLEDSGYLSLHNSRIADHRDNHIDDHRDNQKEASGVEQQSVVTPIASPPHSPLKTDPNTLFTRSLGNCTPTKCDWKTAASEHIVSSTPTAQHSDPNLPNLPILRFQRAVCDELSRGFQRTQRYDWSVVDKLAEDYVLDRVIGRQMGLEYVDVFSSLLSRNMRGILTFILAQLGDMDLISCKKVSRTWERIICEDKAALCRCEQAEQTLQDLRFTPGPHASGLTRDVSLSRVVLSCMQTLASSTPSSSFSTPSFSTPSSSTPSSSSSTPCSRTSRRVPSSQKDGAPTRFQEFIDAASSLKQHECLYRCKRCGFPAKTLTEAGHGTCTRSSCLFDFCTRCQEAFHGASPCRALQPRAQPSSKSNILAGSARSKRNVRRL